MRERSSQGRRPNPNLSMRKMLRRLAIEARRPGATALWRPEVVAGVLAGNTLCGGYKAKPYPTSGGDLRLAVRSACDPIRSHVFAVSSHTSLVHVSLHCSAITWQPSALWRYSSDLLMIKIPVT
jgi:hypothetical protein